MKQAVKVRHLIAGFEQKAVLWDVNFEVPQQSLVAIAGPNGAGKSTLIKAILGLIKPLGGQIEVMGLQKKFHSQCAYVPQNSCVQWDFPITVQEFVTMGCYQKCGLLKKISFEDKQRVHDELKRFEMLGFADRQIDALSLGQKQRVFIARAFVQQASVYFMDEPFAGIDAVSSTVIEQALHEKKQEGSTLLVIHHDLSSIMRMFDRVILLNQTVIAQGPVSEAFTEPLIAKTYGKKEELMQGILDYRC